MRTRAIHKTRFLALAISGVVAGALGCGDGRSPDVPETETPTARMDRLLLASARASLPAAEAVLATLPDPTSGGAQLVNKYCASCHVVPRPESHSATDWPRVLRKMWMRIEGVAPAFDLEVPTAGERVAIVQYMVDNALRVTQQALPAGPGRDLVTETCARCHELADPRQHSAEDWPSVVRRMSDHMQHMLGTPLSNDEIVRISSYLGSVSRGPA